MFYQNTFNITKWTFKIKAVFFKAPNVLNEQPQ